jgi:hypothetical protein
MNIIYLGGYFSTVIVDIFELVHTATGYWFNTDPLLVHL